MDTYHTDRQLHKTTNLDNNKRPQVVRIDHKIVKICKILRSWYCNSFKLSFTLNYLPLILKNTNYNVTVQLPRGNAKADG